MGIYFWGIHRTRICQESISHKTLTWWSHQMETFSALLALCAGNSPVTGEFPTQRPMTRSFDVFFDRRLNKRLSKQSWGLWFETPSRLLWRHCNGNCRSSFFNYFFICIIVGLVLRQGIIRTNVTGYYKRQIWNWCKISELFFIVQWHD